MSTKELYLRIVIPSVLLILNLSKKRIHTKQRNSREECKFEFQKPQDSQAG